jgi:hypothetical protein
MTTRVSVCVRRNCLALSRSGRKDAQRQASRPSEQTAAADAGFLGKLFGVDPSLSIFLVHFDLLEFCVR